MDFKGYGYYHVRISESIVELLWNRVLNEMSMSE